MLGIHTQTVQALETAATSAQPWALMWCGFESLRRVAPDTYPDTRSAHVSLAQHGLRQADLQRWLRLPCAHAVVVLKHKALDIRKLQDASPVVHMCVCTGKRRLVSIGPEPPRIWFGRGRSSKIVSELVQASASDRAHDIRVLVLTDLWRRHGSVFSAPAKKNST